MSCYLKTALCAVTAAFTLAISPRTQTTDAIPVVAYHTITVSGTEIFYRESGNPHLPVLILLHGRQTSSHMFRNIIPILATKYHVFAPDMPGFGMSGTPDIIKSTFTFDYIAAVMQAMLGQLGIKKYGIVMHDFGVPVGMRLVTGDPKRVTFLVVQNGIICATQTPGPEPWLQPFWDHRDPAAEQRLRASYQLKTTRKYYLVGARNPELVSPDSWALDQYYMDMPGRHDLYVELQHDVPSNDALYGTWQKYLHDFKPRVLVQWGKESPISNLDQPPCWTRGNPNAKLSWYDSGQMLLEEHAVKAASEIITFGTLGH